MSLPRLHLVCIRRCLVNASSSGDVRFISTGPCMFNRHCLSHHPRSCIWKCEAFFMCGCVLLDRLRARGKKIKNERPMPITRNRYRPALHAEPLIDEEFDH